MEFDYLSEGVMCEGRWYPALKMEWVQAVELIPFVEKNLQDSAKLADLAVKFAVWYETWQRLELLMAICSTVTYW